MDPTKDFLNPATLEGALVLGALFFALSSVAVVLIRGAVRRVERHLSDITALQFISALAQLLAYLIGFVLYAHMVPELRALGTALLAGVSVVSVVVGLAAQSTLGNLVAYVAVVAVLVLGMFVRTRGGRRDVEEVERRNLRGVLDPERTSAKGEQP